MIIRERKKDEGGREKDGGNFIRIKGNAVTIIVRLVMPVYFGLSPSFRIAIFGCTHTYTIHLGWPYV